MVSKKRVEQMLQEEIKKAREAGVPISIDIDPVIEFPKAQSFYGMCHRRDEKHPTHNFRIRISEYFLPALEDEIRQTIMHELIHTCDNCMNHGKEWKHWASVINSKYGYDIARISDYHEFSLRQEAERRRGRAASVSVRRYKIYCPECGRQWYRKRRSRITENVQRYQCPYCKILGGLRVEEL